MFSKYLLIPERFTMADSTTKRPRSSSDDEDSPSESKKLKTKELFLKSCIMMLKAANYKPYLDLESKNDEYMCRGQDAAISGDSTSSATPSASEMGDSPPHESTMSPSSYPNFLHTGPTSTFHSTAATSSPPQVGAASPSYSNGAMSPTHSPGAVSPTHSTGAVSPSHSTGGAVSPAHSSEASYPPYSSASISPTAAERLGGNPNEEDDGQITCFCLKPHGERRMIFCNECERWLHFSCVKIRKDPNPDGNYTCPGCVASKQTMRKSARQRAVKKVFDP